VINLAFGSGEGMMFVHRVLGTGGTQLVGTQNPPFCGGVGTELYEKSWAPSICADLERGIWVKICKKNE